MRMINNGFRLLSASTLVLASAFTMPGVAHAQLFFDWGGGTQKVNDTGRQPVRINSDAKPGEIIVSFTDRKLYLITGPGQAISYPVAIPREQDRWEGKTTVSQKRENPSWTPTPTMIKENPRLPRWVPGGHPMNPLGNRALYLGSSLYRIHGTDAPWTIGTAVSKGCIRMYNKDALDVYERSKVGAKVLVTWNAYQTTADGEAPQAAAVQEEAPASSRASTGGSSRRNAERETAAPAAAPVPAVSASAGAPAAATAGQKRAESRYSDIFGTPEPAAPAAAQRPAGESDPARAARPARERENQPQREPRKTRDATAERVRAEPAATSTTATPEAAGAIDAAPARPKAAEQRPRPAPVETGSLPERRSKPKSASPEAAAAPAQAQVQAPQAAQPDATTRAAEAAVRAAAAAERAAAAAERAEKAMAARAAAPAASAVAPAAAPEPASGGSD